VRRERIYVKRTKWLCLEELPPVVGSGVAGVAIVGGWIGRRLLTLAKGAYFKNPLEYSINAI
jgi:hypothetical protein